MNVSRRGFIGLLAGLPLGIKCMGGIRRRMERPALPNLVGLKPGQVPSVFQMVLAAGMSIQAATDAHWRALRNLDLPCSRCGVQTLFRKATRASHYFFGKLTYECPDCGFKIDMPIMSDAIPEGEADNDSGRGLSG